MASTTAPKTAIRVFVSSTFIDMQAERDFLIGQVFPDIRRRCAVLGVDFEVIDLRWGVSGESSDAQVLDYCLDQLEGCLPYLFAMIGSRYGWVPGEKPEIAPMLDADELACSVTEIEILRFERGAARAGVAPRALVGLRSERFTAQLGVGEQLSEASRHRLDLLRARLAPPRSDSFDYADLATLEQQVRSFFLSEAALLANQLASPARRIDGRQTQYLNLLKIAGVARIPLALEVRSDAAPGSGERWTGLDEAALVKRLDGEQLHVVLGGPGSGKTALCAELARRWADSGNGRRVLRLHIGATGELSLNGVLRDLYRLADAREAEDWADALVAALDAEALPTLIVLDGVERISGWNQPLPATLEAIAHQPQQLLWTIERLLRAHSRPTILVAVDGNAQPANAFGLALHDAALDLDAYAAALPFSLVRIRPLDADRRGKFARAFFDFRGKHLTADQLERIAAADVDDFDSLHLACDRLRRFGRLQRDKHAQDAFVAATIDNLFGQSRDQAAAAIFDEARDALGLDAAKVDAGLRLLAVSRYGLPAGDLVEVARRHLGAGDFSLRDWAVLEGMFGPFLVRNGLRFQYKNAAAMHSVTAALDDVSDDAARAALADYLLARTAGLGIADIFAATVDSVLPNELALQLSHLPGHPGWRRVLNPHTLLAWFARDWEVSLVELNEVFSQPAFYPAGPGGAEGADELATIAAFRQEANEFLSTADAFAQADFVRALAAADNALLLPEAQAEAAAAGAALLAVLTTACAFCAALVDSLPNADHCQRAIESGVALLLAIADQRSVKCARASPMHACLAEWHVQAAACAPDTVGFMHERDMGRLEMSMARIQARLA